MFFPQMHPPVEKNAAHVVVADGGFLGTGGHPQRSEKAVDQNIELVDVPVITPDTHRWNKIILYLG